MVDGNVTPFEIDTTTRHGELVRPDVHLPHGDPLIKAMTTVSPMLPAGRAKA